MKSFLVINKKPLIKWTKLSKGKFYKGDIPKGYHLAVNPSGNYIIVDVDRHGSKDGFRNIPSHLQEELDSTFSYGTKNNGRHYWFKYTGDYKLANKPSGLGIDLRTDKGYVVWYTEQLRPENLIESGLVKETSSEMNSWLKEIFGRLSKER